MNKLDYKKGYEDNYQDLRGPIDTFTKGLYSILINKELLQAEKRLLFFLYTINKKDNEVTCTVNMIIRRTGLKESTVHKTINSLQEKGYIEKKKRGKRNNRYFTLKVLKEFDNTNNWLKIYDKLWCYPIFNYADVLVYSYYLTIKDLSQYKNSIEISTSHVAEKLGLTKSTVSVTNKKLKESGIISITGDNKIKILVNFSFIQPEETEWFERIESIKSQIANDDEFPDEDINEEKFNALKNKKSNNNSIDEDFLEDSFTEDIDDDDIFKGDKEFCF